LFERKAAAWFNQAAAFLFYRYPRPFRWERVG